MSAGSDGRQARQAARGAAQWCVRHLPGARRAFAASAVLVLLASLGSYGQASAGAPGRPVSPRVVQLQQISGANPFARSACGRSFGPVNTAIEPHLAVSSRNPNLFAAAWIQDFGKTHMTAYSKDGGRTWKRVALPGISDCTGGARKGNYDPWLSFGPEGTLYTSGMSGSPPDTDPLNTAPQDAILVSRSGDGGRSWQLPAQVEPADTYNDKPVVLADPKRPGRVFVIFSKKEGPFGAVELAERIAVSLDGGRTFGPSRPFYTPLPGTIADGNQLLRGSGGALLYVTLQQRVQNHVPGLPPADQHVTIMRSTDDGSTWEGPIDLGSIMGANVVSDPDTGHGVVTGEIPVLAVGPRGRAYVAWTVTTGPSTSHVVFVRSTDDGRTWSVPRSLASPAGQSLLPAIAAMADGTVGAAWYDTRRDQSGDGRLTTDVWFAYSRDEGRSWRQVHLAGPFDMNTAWDDFRYAAPQHGLGDYFGFVATPDGFASVFIMARPQARTGQSQAFFARLRLTG